MIFPNDENGDVLRRMQETGDRLEKPRDIDFSHVFPREEEAGKFLKAVHGIGYKKVCCKFWDERKVWDTCVTVFMVPTHEEITGIEVKLDALARKFLGRADGWGCMSVE